MRVFTREFVKQLSLETKFKRVVRSSGEATRNNISGSTLGGDVIGGLSNSGDTTNNTVKRFRSGEFDVRILRLRGLFPR